MPKKLKSFVKLHIEATKATPAPPIGPALAPHGINISEFCKQFNDASKDQAGFKLPVDIMIYEDRTFEFKLKTPLTSQLLKKAVGIEKGSGQPNRKKVGKITREQLKEIAKIKLPDLNTKDMERAINIVAGTAKSLGLEVV